MNGRVDAATVVGDLDLDGFLTSARANYDPAAGRTGVDGIEHQVLDDHVDLCRIAIQLRYLLELRLQSDMSSGGQFLENVDRRGDSRAQVGLLRFGFFQVGEVAEVLDDLLDPLEALA